MIYSVNASEEASTPQSIYSHGLVPDEDGFKMWECTMCTLFNLECEDLMNKGISGTGEGFDVPGRHFGGFLTKPPHSSLRQTASSAADRLLQPPAPICELCGIQKPKDGNSKSAVWS
ncbi:unnamed protein product [Fraxinus pennsylvanica]|uniref:Uncharacterized protein n=1 Tax=Fraxinus pennsylvanica TaxID=56036 RepID=A0AAD2DQ40_9LAMI|nr:unnamed protein product [Fraxinus pennsylvanica]